ALLLGSLGRQYDEHTKSGKCGDLHVSPPSETSDRRIALSHTRYVALALSCYVIDGTPMHAEAVFNPNQQRT
ncbi:MAG: hypothetical protein WBM51_25635, partial [Pseudolabrys sp.]